MNKAKALIKYNKQAIDTIDKMDSLLKTVVDNMEKLMLQDIAQALKNKDTQISIVNKLYNAEFWKDNQDALYRKKDVLLDKFFKIYKKDIDKLKAIYPGSDFNTSSISYQLEQYNRFLTSELDILKIMKVSEPEAVGLVRMAQFSNLTDNENLIKLIARKINTPIASMKNRLYTTQSVIYRTNRNNFYRSIKEAGLNKRYIYAGPSDAVTREFCRTYIGQIKTEGEWRALQNNQIGAAWSYGGGYNCRHATYLVTNNWTKAEVVELQNYLKKVA